MDWWAGTLVLASDFLHSPLTRWGAFWPTNYVQILLNGDLIGSLEGPIPSWVQ